MHTSAFPSDFISFLARVPHAHQFSDMVWSLSCVQVSGPVLTADDRKTIGTRKRYGVAADVIYGVGGVLGMWQWILLSCLCFVCAGESDMTTTWRVRSACVYAQIAHCGSYPNTCSMKPTDSCLFQEPSLSLTTPSCKHVWMDSAAESLWALMLRWVLPAIFFLFRIETQWQRLKFCMMAHFRVHVFITHMYLV